MPTRLHNRLSLLRFFLCRNLLLVLAIFRHKKIEMGKNPLPARQRSEKEEKYVQPTDGRTVFALLLFLFLPLLMRRNPGGERGGKKEEGRKSVSIPNEFVRVLKPFFPFLFSLKGARCTHTILFSMARERVLCPACCCCHSPLGKRRRRRI